MKVQRAHTPQHMRPARLTTEAYLEAAGILNVRFEKTELLDGIVYEMPTDQPLTRRWNSVLQEWLIRNKGDDIALVSHQTLPLGEFWAPSPDHYLFPVAVGDENVSGSDVLLVIELSDTTIAYDLGGKADAYAGSGVREYWVIDPNSRQVHVHQLSAAGVYGPPAVYTATDRIEPRLVPGLALRIADLPRIN